MDTETIGELMKTSQDKSLPRIERMLAKMLLNSHFGSVGVEYGNALKITETSTDIDILNTDLIEAMKHTYGAPIK